ncbi:hypothetical protein BGZ93_005497 [Podila epicladia]|nr:hypothetical protein BGZ92_005549 [Podila epicladia]KAG0095758.1 hypothetical protein BGZ93_005497 [Podila epicladia]
MDPFPNPYSALIATFNQVSPLDSTAEDADDPQHLNDDDLLLWANAEFTYDIPPGVGIYEEDLVAKLAQTQQQYEQLQRQHQQHLQQQQLQQQQQQFQQQQQQPHLMTSQPQQNLGLYNSTDIQRQMQQFDALHRYLDSNEDPRTSLSVVERSRQRNPVTSQPPTAAGPQQQLHYDTRMNTPFQTPPTTGVNPTAISPAAARLLRQPFLTLQQQQLQQYSAASSPLASPTTSSVPDFHPLQGPSVKATAMPEETPASVATVSKRTVSARKDSSVPSTPASPASSTTSIKASSTATPSEERANQLEAELDEYEAELEDSTSASKSAIADGLSQDDPDYAAKLAAEEDKRRRNTAASARFRHKKRLREQVLEKTAKEMTAKSELLEIRVRELEMEIKWLRGLIVEKDSRMLETLPSSEVSSVAAASTALAGGKGAKEGALAKAPSKRGKKNAV